MDMSKVAQAVSGTLPLIIACTIFLHQLITKLVATMDVMRRLTSEYRKSHQPGQEPEPKRDQSLKHQIKLYHKRASHIRFGLSLVTTAELAFIVTIVLSIASATWPLTSWLAAGCALSLLAGLALLAWAACHELAENSMLADILDSEVKDLDLT